MNESYLREIGGFGLSSIHMRTKLKNMAAFLENKRNILVKMNAMTREVTPKPVLATEAGYVNHSLDILDQPDEN